MLCLSVSTHLHEFLVAVEVCHQHVFSVRHAGQRDAQAAGGPAVAVGRQHAMHYGPHDLHQVEGGVHGA